MMVKDVRISPLNYAKHTFYKKIPVKNKDDKKKQMRALMPNLIHSLDAASMFMLINKYFIRYLKINRSIKDGKLNDFSLMKRTFNLFLNLRKDKDLCFIGVKKGLYRGWVIFRI